MTGVTLPVASSAFTTCVVVRPLSFCSTRYASEPSRRKWGARSLICGVLVKARWFEPSLAMSQMSLLPSRFETNAIVSPSGDTVGCELSAGSWVSCTASEPVIGCRKICR